MVKRNAQLVQVQYNQHLQLHCKGAIQYNQPVIFQLTRIETGTESKPIQLTRTETESWPSKRTRI